MMKKTRTFEKDFFIGLVFKIYAQIACMAEVHFVVAIMAQI